MTLLFEIKIEFIHCQHRAIFKKLLDKNKQKKTKIARKEMYCNLRYTFI